MDYLKSFDDVIYAERVFADFDIIAKIKNHNEERFKDIVWSIRNYDTITSSVTIIVSRSYAN